MSTNNKLSQQELDHFKDLLYNSKWKYTFEYGDRSNNKIRETCKRIIHTDYHPKNILGDRFGGSETLLAYQVSYMYSTGYIPTQNICHDCANPYNSKETLCIEPSHMRQAPHSENMSRRTCHCLIRNYEIKTRIKNKGTKGTIFVDVVPIDDKIKIYKKANKQITEEMIRKRETRQNCSCPHSPHDCFINYGNKTYVNQTNNL